MNPQQLLKEFKPEKEFFVGIDSDGCVFDTMEIKHKECFCPNTIKYWNLQVVSKYARETWDFVNLYSKDRGCNRFIALIEVFELLRNRKEVKARHAHIPALQPLIEWTEKETKLGQAVLEQYAKQISNPVIDCALTWSKAINKDIAELVHDIPPFPLVKESMHKIHEKADIMVVSQTPVEALNREWKENGLQKYVKLVAGQEFGKKSEQLKYTAKGKYADDKILMIGDAIGDLKAAKENNVSFYPINPGHEEASWERFYHEAMNRFFNGTYKGLYENTLIEEFEKYLPEYPPWK